MTYGKTVEYRSRGAVEAAKVGAVAALLRSVTTFSIDSPHTGTQFYSDNVPKIPAACITIEDSTFMHRLQDRGFFLFFSNEKQYLKFQINLFQVS